MPHSNYLPERMGTAAISPTGKFEAGSFQSFTAGIGGGRAAAVQARPFRKRQAALDSERAAGR